jgi:hypothetical protein
MSPTIRLSNETKGLLDALRRQRHLKSYDEVVMQAARSAAVVPDSLFGSLKGSQPFHHDLHEDHQS